MAPFEPFQLLLVAVGLGTMAGHFCSKTTDLRMLGVNLCGGLFCGIFIAPPVAGALEGWIGLVNMALTPATGGFFAFLGPIILVTTHRLALQNSEGIVMQVAAWVGRRVGIDVRKKEEEKKS